MMNILKSIIGFIISACFFLLAGPSLAQGPTPEPVLPAATPAFAPGEIIVKFKDEAGAQNSLQAAGLHPWQTSPSNELLRVQVAPGQEAQMIARLQARSDVAFATYNYHIQALGDPNDPYYSLQWALKQALDHDIDAPEAWNLSSGDSSVTIAFVDTGVDLDHPDLQAKIVSGYNYISSSSLPDDDNGHGTHVAGIAAAIGNNNTGIAGVNWEARIMPLKVLDSSGNGGTYNLALAIRYAADNGAKVINMSLGGSCGSGWPDVEDAVNYALDQGVLLVAASGNNYSTPLLCPGAIAGVMAVGATDSSDARAAYSTYGSGLAVVAPGSSIYSTVPPLSKFSYQYYTYLSGTSMATPHVAGLAALVWSYAPSLTNDQVQQVIQNSADDLGDTGWDQYYGYGRINARQALEMVMLYPSPSHPRLLVGDNEPSNFAVVQINTVNPENITWTASLSPTVSWLSLTPPTSGVVSASSADQKIILQANQSTLYPNYGVYTTTLTLTGVTASGLAVGFIPISVRVEYVQELQKFYLPLIFKN